MTSVETAPLPSQPPGITDPVSITEIVSDPSPLQGPDGRIVGDDVTRIPEVPKPPQETHIETDNTSMDTSRSKTEEKSKVASELRILEPEKDTTTDETSERVVDIVKQSKLQETSKSTSDLGELPEFPPSRPLTETTARDGTKVSIDTEKEKRASNTNLRASNSNLDKESTKTPFSVRVERKPLHTAQARSHSDYFTKTPSTSRYTYIAASLSQYTGFEPDLKGKENFFMQAPPQQMRARRPPKLVRLATVTMTPKTKPAPRGPSLYYEEPKKPLKVITWDEATEARPPLRIDMEGPGPTNYSPRIKPLMETNSPAWTFGGKCQPEKAGGSRTSWEKPWFASPSVWTNKVDFHNDSAWPSPTHYKSKPVLGPRQRTMTEFPSFTIGTRDEVTFSKAGSNKEPSPVDYDKDIADKLVYRRGPSFSHQFRREGTITWGSQDKTPGPGAYTPNYSYNKPHGPSFSIRSLRREKSHGLGPFSTF